MEDKIEMRRLTAGGCGAILIVLGALLGALFFAPEHECPEDYWPHQVTMPEPCPPMLMTILTEAAQAYDTAPAAEKPLILQCITLTLECAWQDLTAHTPSQQDDHAEAVRRARDFALAKDWANVNKFMTPASPIPGETIDHPH